MRGIVFGSVSGWGEGGGGIDHPVRNKLQIGEGVVVPRVIVIA